jgi:hypothetical protein
MGAGEVSQIFNNILPPKWWNGVDYTPQAMLEPIFIGSPNDQSVPSGGVTGITFDNRHDSLELSPEYDFNMSTQNPPTTGNMPTSVIGGYGGTLGDYNSPQIQIGSPNKDIQFNQIEPKFPLRYGDTQQQQQQQKQATTGASSFPGFVISKAGSTVLYNCSMYRKGLDNDPEVVQVRILQIDPTDTIPANTGIMISEIKATRKDDFGAPVAVTLYYGQVAVWLG